MLQEFRDFITKGNMIDIAVGFIMGAAFTAVVNGLVANVLMPIIAIPFGQPSFDDIVWTVNGSEILIGAFATAIVTFVLVAFGTFLFVVKPYNAYRARTTAEDEAAPFGPTELDLLTEIRDSLRRRES